MELNKKIKVEEAQSELSELALNIAEMDQKYKDADAKLQEYFAKIA